MKSIISGGCWAYKSGLRIFVWVLEAGVERKRLFGSREREGKLKITFPFYGKGTGIRKCYGKGREWEI